MVWCHLQTSASDFTKGFGDDHPACVSQEDFTADSSASEEEEEEKERDAGDGLSINQGQSGEPAGY
jgi:hypothetical protein